MTEGGPLPPLPDDQDQLRQLLHSIAEMLQMWRERKDAFVGDYVMVDRWAQSPKIPQLETWAFKLLYSPLPGQPDTRLRDPRLVFGVAIAIAPYLPPNPLWHCMERLRQLRADALNHAFVPGRLSVEVQAAVYNLLSLSEALADRLLVALEKTALFVPNDLQRDILNALDGRALKKQALAAEVCGGEGSRLYRSGKKRAGDLNELLDRNLVLNKSGLGYYRPDRPPP